MKELQFINDLQSHLGAKGLNLPIDLDREVRLACLLAENLLVHRDRHFITQICNDITSDIKNGDQEVLFDGLVDENYFLPTLANRWIRGDNFEFKYLLFPNITHPHYSLEMTISYNIGFLNGLICLVEEYLRAKLDASIESYMEKSLKKLKELQTT